MSTDRKTLKIVSIIQFVLGIVTFIFGAILLAGTGLAEGDPISFVGAEFDPVTWAIINGVAFDVLGVLQIICAVLGIHGANRPSALGSHFLFAAIVIIVAVIAGIISSALGEFSMPTLIVVVAGIALSGAVFDKRVRKELDR